jgi:DNA-binding response OmpR family regulator
MTARRLLIVDDEPAFGEFVARAARELGYQTEVTHHGDKFIQAYPRFKPDLIILDVVMPDLDGIDLIRWLAAERCTARIIVVTGYNPSYASMAEQIGRGLGGLTISTMRKPVSLNQLRKVLEADAPPADPPA